MKKVEYTKCGGVDFLKLNGMINTLEICNNNSDGLNICIGANNEPPVVFSLTKEQENALLELLIDRL